MTSRAARRPDRSLPWPVLALAILATLFFAMPLAGLISRAPWSDIGSILTNVYKAAEGYPVARKALLAYGTGPGDAIEPQPPHASSGTDR